MTALEALREIAAGRLDHEHTFDIFHDRAIAVAKEALHGEKDPVKELDGALQVLLDMVVKSNAETLSIDGSTKGDELLWAMTLVQGKHAREFRKIVAQLEKKWGSGT